MPDYIGFYLLLLFYLIHLPGTALVNLAVWAMDGSRDGEAFKIGFPAAIIAINAGLVFFLSWVRRRN